MSDARLRDLERRFLQSGSPGDEAAYLLERMRVGDLTEERLERAAHYGHAAARCATGTDHGNPAWQTGGLAAFSAGVAQLGRSALVRALIIPAGSASAFDNPDPIAGVTKAGFIIKVAETWALLEDSAPRPASEMEIEVAAQERHTPWGRLVRLMANAAQSHDTSMWLHDAIREADEIETLDATAKEVANALARWMVRPPDPLAEGRFAPLPRAELEREWENARRFFAHQWA